METFNFNGYTYRTNSDATLIEAKDPKGWTRTGSLRIRTVALAYLQTLKNIRG